MIARMRVAVESQEDSRLHRALLKLLIRIDEVYPSGEHNVWEVYRIIRSRLLVPNTETLGGSASDYSAAFRDLATLSGTLMSRRLDAGTVREKLGEILTQFNPACLGKKISQAVASLLVSITRRDPDAPEWLITIFGTPGVALEIKLSIADALLQLEGRTPGGRAAALKEREDCPPEVATLIVTQLRT